LLKRTDRRLLYSRNFIEEFADRAFDDDISDLSFVYAFNQFRIAVSAQ
jgi:hypothetical protein